MVEIHRKAAYDAEETRLVKGLPKNAPTVLRPSTGGAGWRPGVPHILLYAGDTPGVSAWPLTQNLAYPESAFNNGDVDSPGQYRDEELLTLASVGMVEPVSPRGTAMHINHFKTAREEYALQQRVVWHPGSKDGVDGRWLFEDAPGDYQYLTGWERFGHLGDFWIGDENTIATAQQALDACAALDINVACIAGSSNEFENHSTVPWGWTKQTADTWNAWLTRPDIYFGVGPVDWWYEDVPGSMAGPWDLNSNDIAVEGAAIAHLTGAVDDEGKNLGWQLFRFSEASVLETPQELAARITTDLSAHAARLGNGNRFDVGFLMDATGSFSGAQGRAVSAFLALIDAFRDAEADIYVAMARYSEYSYRQYFDGSTEERPYALQYPMASVRLPEEFAALQEAIVLQPPAMGGGDTPETEWEAIYQIASGAGIDANGNGSSLDSGSPGVPGVNPNDFPGSDIYNAYHDIPRTDDMYMAMRGPGYMYPGASGDVPSYGRLVERGTASVMDRRSKIIVYEG